MSADPKPALSVLVEVAREVIAAKARVAAAAEHDEDVRRDAGRSRRDRDVSREERMGAGVAAALRFHSAAPLLASAIAALDEHITARIAECRRIEAKFGAAPRRDTPRKEVSARLATTSNAVIEAEAERHTLELLVAVVAATIDALSLTGEVGL